MNSPSSVPADEPARYPTAREVVAAELETDAEPPRFAYPCQDLDGNERTLFLVPLGQRIAIVCPEGATAVLDEQAFLDLDGELNDVFMTEAPGGLMIVGRTTGHLMSSVIVFDPATEIADTHAVTEEVSVSVDTHAYSTRATLHLGAIHSQADLSVDLEAVRALQVMFADAERVMLGEVVPVEPDDDENDTEAETADHVPGTGTGADTAEIEKGL